MPGIDFARLRAEITMQQVLDQLGFEPVACLGDQLHGPCPSTARRGRGVGRSGGLAAIGDTTVTNATATATSWNCGPRSTICPFTRPRWISVEPLDTASRGRLVAEATGTEEKRHRYLGRPKTQPRPIDYLDRRCIDYLDRSQHRRVNFPFGLKADSSPALIQAMGIEDQPA